MSRNRVPSPFPVPDTFLRVRDSVYIPFFPLPPVPEPSYSTGKIGPFTQLPSSSRACKGFQEVPLADVDHNDEPLVAFGVETRDCRKDAPPLPLLFSVTAEGNILPP